MIFCNALILHSALSTLAREYYRDAWYLTYIHIWHSVIKFKLLNLISLSGPFSITSDHLTDNFLLLPTLPPSMAAAVSSVLCCVTSRAYGYVTNSLSLQWLIRSDYALIRISACPFYVCKFLFGTSHVNVSMFRE